MTASITELLISERPCRQSIVLSHHNSNGLAHLLAGSTCIPHDHSVLFSDGNHFCHSIELRIFTFNFLSAFQGETKTKVTKLCK
jgi:hypothetical protein